MLKVVRRISLESYIITAICLADLALTCVWINGNFAHEGNPLMNFYLQHGLVPFVVMKLALIAFPIGILEWARKFKPVFVKRVARFTIAAYLGVYGVGFLRVNIPTLMNNQAINQAKMDDDFPDTIKDSSSHGKASEMQSMSVKQASLPRVTD